MNSGNPGDLALTPLEREWAKEEAERVQEKADLDAAMALESDGEGGVSRGDTDGRNEAAADADYNYTLEHRHVNRFTIAERELDREKLSEDDFIQMKAERAIFSVKWSGDNRCIAASYGSGHIRVFDGASGLQRYEVNVNCNADAELNKHAIMKEDSAGTVTSIRWRPTDTWSNGGHYTLLSANSQGTVHHWKVGSPFDAEDSKLTQLENDVINCPGMHAIDCIKVGDGFSSAPICLDYDKAGRQFVAGCKDAVLRVFDEETGQQTHTLDGGEGNTFTISEKDMLNADRGWYGDGYARVSMSAKFSRGKIKKESAENVIRKTGIKELTDDLNTQMVTVAARHSNRIYSCKFASGLSSVSDHMVVSGGWDTTLQCWDLRAPGPSVKSFRGAYLAGDALDVYENTILTASNRYDNQVQLWDMRFGKDPVSVKTVEGNLAFAAGFSKGASWEVEDRFFCAGGIGPAEESDLIVFDYKRENQVACIIPAIPGGVVALDWANVTAEDLATASKKMNSSKGSVAGGRIAIACGDDSIRMVEVCTRASEKYVDDDEDLLESSDKVSAGSDLFATFMKSNNRERITQAPGEIDESTGDDDIERKLANAAALLDSAEGATEDELDLDPKGMVTRTKHTSSHTGLPSLPGAAKKEDTSFKSPRGTSLTSESLPLLPGTKPFPKATSTPTPDSGTAPTKSEDTPTTDAIITAAEGIPSPFHKGVDEHINEFLDDMVKD